MACIDWKEVFPQGTVQLGTTEEELQDLAATLWMPLTEEEVQTVNASQSNPFPPSDPLHAAYKPFDPRQWQFPSRPLPSSYLSFLGWSNGGEFVNGDRQIGFFSTADLREFLLSYHVPQYMPGSQPIAFDGGGCFYLLDMRDEPDDGEYPVLFVALEISAT